MHFKAVIDEEVPDYASSGSVQKSIMGQSNYFTLSFAKYVARAGLK